ncbi:MAG: hypothetical protein ABSE76_03475 [Minisyncoccia bacterium]|jgi:hypothetical protein
MAINIKRFLRYAFFALVGLFALIGLLFTGVFFGMQFGLLNVRGSIAERNAFFAQFGAVPDAATSTPPCIDPSKAVCDWRDTPEWPVIAGGLTKDKDILTKVSAQTGVPARMIVATVVPEQIRFFTSEREIFKHYFEPLKILGSLSQFSLGVSGIKQDTAEAIEAYAADPSSPFYPGPGYAALMAYSASTTPHDAELYDRLTDANDHYYSYLYTAVYIKEVETEWSAAGFDISTDPGVVVTLFNIGFQNSHPNANPIVGGAVITTGGQNYTYGELGRDFYDSGELTDLFPIN